MGISRTWCQSGEFVLECENNRITMDYIQCGSNCDIVMCKNS